MNQMLFPTQLGMPQNPGQTSENELVETTETPLFGAMVGLFQQPELAADWRRELESLGNSLPPEQAEALSGWLQQLADGKFEGEPLAETLPKELRLLLEQRMPALAAQLSKLTGTAEDTFRQALSQLQDPVSAPGASKAAVAENVEGRAANKGLPVDVTMPSAGSLADESSRLWSLKPLAKMIQQDVMADSTLPGADLLEGLELVDDAKPLRGLTQAVGAELRTGELLTRTVDMPIQDARWGRAFAEQVMLVQQAGGGRARMILDPPALGPVEVDMKMQGDQATIVFHSPHQAVRDSLENSLPRLREMLAEQGVDLQDVNVSDQHPSEQQESRESFFAEGARRGGDSEGESGEDSATTQTMILDVGLGLVDYYA